MTYSYSCFIVAQRPRLKKRYQLRVERVREYLEIVKDFDKLVSPQSLFHHFLGPESSTKVRNDLEVMKKSKHFFSFCLLLISSSFSFFILFYLFSFLFLFTFSFSF